MAVCKAHGLDQRCKQSLGRMKQDNEKSDHSLLQDRLYLFIYDIQVLNKTTKNVSGPDGRSYTAEYVGG